MSLSVPSAGRRARCGDAFRSDAVRAVQSGDGLHIDLYGAYAAPRCDRLNGTAGPVRPLRRAAARLVRILPRPAAGAIPTAEGGAERA